MRIIIAILLFFTFRSEGQIINASQPYRPVSCDVDAQNFIDSSGLTDQTQKDAICTLVKELKDNNLWNSMYAIYPFVGGTADAHKWNLKDPRNSNAAYRLTFSGVWTHSSTGGIPVFGQGSFANTYINLNSIGSQNSVHISFYSRTNAIGATVIIGAYDGASETTIYPRYTGDLSYASCSGNTAAPIGTGITSSAAYYIAYRNSSTRDSLRIGGTNYSRALNSVGLTNREIYIGALNFNGTPSNYSNRECAFATVGSGLSTNQAIALNIIVEKFNDAIGRGVQ